jgi:hypothetical protein
MQIQVQSYTQPTIGDQSIDIGPKISTTSGITEASSISLIPHVVGIDRGDDFTQGNRDSKVGFGITSEKATRHVLRPNAPLVPIATEGTYVHTVPYLGPQQPYSPQTISPSSPQVPQQGQDHPGEQTHPRRHPYSLS